MTLFSTPVPHARACRLLRVGLSLAAALVLAGCQSAATVAPVEEAVVAEGARDTVTLSAEAATRAGVVVAPATVVSRADQLTAPGLVTLNERRTARIGALAEGVVIDVAVQPGDRVARGARMATVLSHLFHDAWASYFKALAGRRTADREVAFARATHERAVRLVRDKALSPYEADRAAADLVHAEQELAAARAEVMRAEQDLQHYGITPREDANPEQEDRIGITAPFDGVVIERLVSSGSAVTPGTPLLVVSDLSTVWVTAEVAETNLGQLSAGRAATIVTEAYPGETFTGTIDAVGDVINPVTRRVTVRLVVPNPERRLKPEMFVTSQLGLRAVREIVVVPTSAVQRMDGEPVVLVRTAEGAYHRRTIDHGNEVDGLVEIRSGVKAGEDVVVTGAFLLKSTMTGGGDPE